jgi:hypothetical protein
MPIRSLPARSHKNSFLRSLLLKTLRKAIVCVALLALTATASPAFAASPEQVQASLGRAKDCLYRAQRPDGLWEYPGLIRDAQGGLTAIATYALLASGESPQNPRLAKAIAYLKQLKSNNVYVLGTRAQIWAYLGETREIKMLVNEDAEHLTSLIKGVGEARGLFYYPQSAPDKYDHSISQYGVLGFWALQQDGAEIGMRVWDVMDEAWRRHQSPAGGWAYVTKGGGDEGDDTISMACAGVATLFITHDYIHAAEERGCNGNVYDANIDRGMKWITDNFAHIYNGKPGRDLEAHLYTLYGVERIGVAAGYKYFGSVNWFESGADYLAGHQNSDGSWGAPNEIWGLNINNIPGTSFGILFLSNGNAPVVIDKLVYSSLPPGVGKKAAPGWWNERPRDCFNLSHWTGAQTENLLRWNIVDLRMPLSELHEAPVLFIAGSMPVAFSDADIAKLRQFVEEGGLILANADCGNKTFSDSIKTACSKIFPRYEFRELPSNHPIYTREQFRAEKWKNKPKLLGLSNGVRELVLLSPDQDPSRVWQVPYQGTIGPFGLGADIIEYAADKTSLRQKRRDWVVTADPRVRTNRSLRMARIEYDGNWDPEPGAWRRMAAINHNVDKVDLQIDVVKLGEGKLDPGVDKLATLTGTAAVRFTALQWNEIKSYAEAGGTILIDAAGGSGGFADAVDSGLHAAFGTAANSLAESIPRHDPIYPPGLGDAPMYRPFARDVVSTLTSPRLRAIKINGRTAVIFSREDLTNGLVGSDVDGVTGYTPEIATRIVGSIVLTVVGH